jgi:hypothetical protein
VATHMITERSTSAQITVATLHPVVFGLSLYFPKGSTMAQMIKNGREDRGSGKGSYSWGDDKDMWR